VFFALKTHCCQTLAWWGLDGTSAKEFPWEAPLHPNHIDLVGLHKFQTRETQQEHHPAGNDRLEPVDLRSPGKALKWREHSTNTGYGEYSA
jgi:hypothetical protein